MEDCNEKWGAYVDQTFSEKEDEGDRSICDACSIGSPPIFVKDESTTLVKSLVSGMAGGGIMFAILTLLGLQ